ncbi:curli production assembly/transport component CsgF [Spirosoma validum]|uniref:Curli production assembly/transport component CsgF n=1 Tax=Spirosoma validum TaxID=2771355 RepID=A0A927GCV6_9BACT|nr:curli production assembly/transport component CsgF [Spirosoma validum]MBD2753142.1 curli assembly protein CsgF [Spirosoma validum]
MKQLVLSFLLLISVPVCALAQAFVYHPNNPNFGGNTFNYSWMLSQAQAQDRNVDPSTRRTTTSSSSSNNTLNNFAQSLQSQLLSRITSSLINKQFGETTLQPGTYKFGDFQVDISNDAAGVIVRIVDGKGGETSVTIPYF